MNFISGIIVVFGGLIFFGNLRLVKSNGWEGDYLRDICRILVHQQYGWHVPDHIHIFIMFKVWVDI